MWCCFALYVCTLCGTVLRVCQHWTPYLLWQSQIAVTNSVFAPPSHPSTRRLLVLASRDVNFTNRVTKWKDGWMDALRCSAVSLTCIKQIDWSVCLRCCLKGFILTIPNEMLFVTWHDVMWRCQLVETLVWMICGLWVTRG